MRGGRLARLAAVVLVYGVPITLVATATFRWFEPGRFVAAGDVGPFYRESALTESVNVWSYARSGAGGVVADAPRLFEAATAGLARSLGGSPEVAQHAFFALVLAFAAAGVTFFFRQLLVGRLVAPVLGAVLALANPGVVSNLPDPLVPATLGALGLFAGVILRAGRSPVPVGIVVLASIPVAYAALWPRGLVVVGVGSLLALGGVLVLYGRSGLRRSATTIGRSSPVLALAHAWWILPLAVAGSGAVSPALAATDPAASLGRALTLTSSAGWDGLPWAVHFEEWPLLAARWFFPAVALAAPVLAPTRPLRRLALWVVAAAVPLVFLHGGPFVLLLVACYATNTAIVLDGLLTRASRWVTSSIPLGAVALYLAVGIGATGFPLFTGDVAPRGEGLLPSSRVRVPEAWPRLGADLNDQGAPGKVLVLPTMGSRHPTTTWGYRGVDDLVHHLTPRPVIASLGDDPQPAHEALVRELERRLLEGHLVGMQRLLDALGVSHVVVRHDFAPYQEPVTPVDDRTLVEALVGTRLFAPPQDYDDVATLFARADVPPTVQAFSSAAAVVPSTRDNVARLLAKLPAETAFVEGATIPVARAGPRDVTTVFYEGAPYFVEFAGSGAEASLDFTPLATVRIGEGGREPKPFAVRVPPTEDVRAVRIGDDVIALGGARRIILAEASQVSFVRADGSTTPPLDVSIAPATASVTLADDQPVSLERQRARHLTEFAPLRECAEARRGTDVVMRRTGETGVRLEAGAGSACTWLPLPGVMPHRTYEVTLEHRNVRGGPARVCVWLDGPDECLAPHTVLAGGGGFTARSLTFRVPSQGAGARLFLYADATADAGSRPTAVEYRNVRLEPYTPAVVSATDRDVHAQSPSVAVESAGRSRYRVAVDAGPNLEAVVALADSADGGWRLRGVPGEAEVRPVVVDGYRQGWLISSPTPFVGRISYRPATLGRVAQAASVLAVLGALLSLVIFARGRARQRRGPVALLPQGVQHQRGLVAAQIPGQRTRP